MNGKYESSLIISSSGRLRASISSRIRELNTYCMISFNFKHETCVRCLRSLIVEQSLNREFRVHTRNFAPVDSGNFVQNISRAATSTLNSLLLYHILAFAISVGVKSEFRLYGSFLNTWFIFPKTTLLVQPPLQVRNGTLLLVLQTT